MNKNDIQLLYQYDRWANHRVLQAISTLDNEQFTRDLGGSFRSVRDTFVHILGGEWIWLTYWKAPSHSLDILLELRKRRDAMFSPNEFPDSIAVQAKWFEVEKVQLEFVDGVSDESLKKMLSFRDTQLSLGHLMQHMANHSTYHRGQISLMLRQLRAEPMATDFHVFLVEAVSEHHVAH